MKTQEILVRAALHHHNWTPGTAYAELEQDVIPLLQTVREFSEQMNCDRPTYGEFKQLLKETAQ